MIERIMLKAAIVDKLVEKLSDRRLEIEKHLKNTMNSRLAEIRWIEYFIYCELSKIPNKYDGNSK